MTKLPKIGGQRLSGINESNNLQVGSFFFCNHCAFNIQLKKWTPSFEYYKFYI